jgi:ArsR family transcriptional regulator, arsenate/arsenite/antimonite-responsive transcriptional repressor
VHAERHQNWMIYSLPKRRSPELEANLRCLQDCVQSHAVFKSDLRKLEALRPEIGWLDDLCVCATPAATRKAKSSKTKGNASK